MRVLVTGGSGLLGAQLTRRLSQAGETVVSAYRTHSPPAGTPVRIDLTKLDSIKPLFHKVRPDVVIHTAAMSDVDLCEERLEIANRLNGEATGRIGEAACEAQSYVIYVSTDYVFDGDAGSYREEDIPNPVNQYGRSKLIGEELLRRSGANHAVARTSVIYGWNREHRPNFATWVLNKLESGQPLKVIENQFASPTLNVNLAEMIIELIDKRLEGIIHLAGATRINRYDFAKQIAQTFHYDPSLINPSKSTDGRWRARRPLDSSLNVGRAESVLSRRPLALHQALAQFFASRRISPGESHFEMPR